MNLTEEQIKLIENKAKLVNITPKEFLNMIIDFFGEMDEKDLKFFTEGFADEDKECCGGGCHN